MGKPTQHDATATRVGFLRRLADDRAGNTFAIVAASVAPLLAMVGGGIDMSRSYLAESRLQQACDSGVLAARKKLGSAAIVEGSVPDEVITVGNRFFNLNFRDGAYGSEDRSFTMSLQDDYAISGTASANVPTTIMRIFGTDNVPVRVACEAQLNFSNLDVMMVLDTTGSMAQTNPGDAKSRLDSLKDTVVSFHAQLEGGKAPGTRIRYGFVPYGTNVNVGGLLEDSWVVSAWAYQSRRKIAVGTTTGTKTYTRNWVDVSGSKSGNVQHSSYPATWHATAATSGSTTVDENENVIVTPGQAAGGYYTCDGGAPADTLTNNDVLLSTTTEPYPGPPTGTRTIESRRRTLDGIDYWTSRSGDTCYVMKTTYSNFVQTYERVTDPTESEVFKWQYKKFPQDVTNWRDETNGCIEERATYEIADYDAVNFSRALDLDIDLVPDGDDDTKWAPMYPTIVYARSMKYNGTGAFTKPTQVTNEDYVNPNSIGLASCPAPASKLAEMDGSSLSAYLASIYPTGQTYHDIGMIWGGRLISPTGLFAAENADIDGKKTSRHLIFLTDGETAPLDLAYSSYGLEPLDERRWSEASPYTLTQTVENRFMVACDEVKKRNVTIWVIGFGTAMTDTLKNCAGDGKWFQANDAAELNDVFSAIAKSMGDLRISK